MSVFMTGSGVSLLGFCWVLMGLWEFGAACPLSCSCSGTRISCVGLDRGVGIVAVPVLSAAEMENITDM